MAANLYYPFPSTSNVQAVFPVKCPKVGEAWSYPHLYSWCRQPNEEDDGLSYPCILEICCVPTVQTEWPVCLEPEYVPGAGCDALVVGTSGPRIRSALDTESVSRCRCICSIRATTSHRK
jgi:hypothetical protein